MPAAALVGGGGDYGRAPSGATPGGAKAKEGSRFIASPIPPDIRLPRPPCVLEGVLSSRFAQPEFKVRCWQPLLVKLTGNRSGEGKEASGRATGAEPLRVPSGGHSPPREPHRSCTPSPPSPRAPTLPRGPRALSAQHPARSPAELLPPRLCHPRIQAFGFKSISTRT